MTVMAVNRVGLNSTGASASVIVDTTPPVVSIYFVFFSELSIVDHGVIGKLHLQMILINIILLFLGSTSGRTL